MSAIAAAAGIADAYLAQGIYNEYTDQFVEAEKLFLGKIDPKTTSHLKEQISEALKEKNISLVSLKGPSATQAKMHGLTNKEISSIATVAINPALLDLDAKATEWLALKGIGQLQRLDQSQKSTGIQAGASLAGALVGRLLTGAFFNVLTPAITAVAGYVAHRYNSYTLNQAGSSYANQTASQAQLEGGIRLLTAEQKASKAVRSQFESKFGLLAMLYSKENGDSYIPLDTLSSHIESAQAAYKKRFGAEYVLGDNDAQKLTGLIVKERLENSWLASTLSYTPYAL